MMAVPPEDLPILAKIPHRPLVPADAREVQTLLHQIATEQMRAAEKVGEIQAMVRDQGKILDAIALGNLERDKKLSSLTTDRQVMVVVIKVLWSVLALVAAGVAWLFGGPSAEWMRRHLGM